MLKIETTKIDPKERSFRVIVNGITDVDSYYSTDHYRGVHIYNEDIIEILRSHSINEIGDHFDRVRFTYEINSWSDYIEINFNIKSNSIYKIAPLISVDLQVETDLWSAGYSLYEFSEALKFIIENLNDKIVRYVRDDEDFVSNGFGFEMDIVNAEENLGSFIDTVLQVSNELVTAAHQFLISDKNKDSITSIFDFPEAVKVPCQQYLMYFAQFLKDLGINAKTEIQEYAHSTLFKIIPSDKEEALDKIKDALDVYINAPALNDLELQNMQNQDLAVVQFQANILHLKSQLMFTKSIIDLKDATIDALQLSNYQLKSQLETITPKEEAEIIPGVVAIKKYDGKWFSVNLPEVINRLKRTFK